VISLGYVREVAHRKGPHMAFRFKLLRGCSRTVSDSETTRSVRFRSETYTTEWMSSLRNRIESNCKFGTYRAPATKKSFLSATSASPATELTIQGLRTVKHRLTLRDSQPNGRR
jgi:hypothetical protein